MKKIALVNVFFPPQSIGGATRVVADNFQVLKTKYGNDWELTVFTSDADYKEPHQLNVQNFNGVRVYRASCIWREHMDWQPQDAKMGKLFREFLQFEKPDIIHFHCIQRLSGSIVEEAKKLEISYIITLHDAWWISDYQFLVDETGQVFPDGHPDPYDLPKPPKEITIEASLNRKLYLKNLLLGAKHLLAVSESFTELYRKNGFPLTQINKNGISSSTEWSEKATNYTKKVVLGHIGGMSEHKGFHLFKEAVLHLKPHNIEILAVDHSQPEDFVQISHWNNVKVTIIGRQSQNAMVELYGRLDVLIAPSIWPESYGLVTREASACGCWIVASDMGGIGEDIIEGQNGFKVKAGSLEDLKSVLQKIDSNAKAFKESVNRQSIRKIDNQVSELVESFYS